MIKLESSEKIKQYKEHLLEKKIFHISEAVETIYSIFNKVKEFELEAKDKGILKTVKFNLKSEYLNNKYFENKKTNPFSFIINDKWLTFYFRINPDNLVSNEIKNTFDSPLNKNPKEFKIYLKNKEDVIKIVELLFIRKLKINIYNFEDINNFEHNEILKTFEKFKKNENRIIETVKKTLTIYRTGQQKYRNTLLQKWNFCCSVTGINEPLILKASHIKPFSESNDYEKYDVENGLLLNPNLDSLFDLNLISFDENGLILLTNSISNETYKTLGVNLEMKLRFVTDGMLKYLKVHRIKFENLN